MANIRMSQNLSVRTELTVRPDLIQSLKLLMEPILNLEQVLRQNLAENPLLEEVEEVPEEVVAPEFREPERKKEEDAGKIEKIDWQEFLGEGNEWVSGHFRDFSENDEERQEATTVVEKTLYDHLFDQLGFTKLTPEELEIGAYIIGNIDDSGFLSCDVKPMAEELQKPPELIEKVLSIIKKFDPPGVGSRDLRECLLAQMDEQGLKDTLAWELVDLHLYTLDKKSTVQLAKTTGSTPERVAAALEVIKGFSPRPAQGRFSKAAAAVVPDLIVEKLDDGYVVFHNDKNLPQLRINQSYRALIKRGNKTPETTKNYVREKLEQARWLINAINQRRSTMINVMEAIVEEQHDFFEHGEDFLKPLTMEQIADKVGMNVATISRVANGKYVQTPLGVFEIKYFFNTGVAMSGGDDLSKRVVKAKIETLIGKEDTASPLSDQEIASLLKQEGITLARRTVTKYREEIGIKSARFRKQSPKKQAGIKAEPAPTPVPPPTTLTDGQTDAFNQA
ncbi:MAG TPA: RNA polymerase sigma-54 factor [candidate division Zixibacteria bacterium]|nr:RNA polymerase sigma-54 factor [candidate division Zixibacteria bacterium]HBY99925.1 RNA polymerase sigma-54 factor [candidate division Zixibacteria bacterium]